MSGGGPNRSTQGFVLFEALVAMFLLVSMLVLFSTAFGLGRRSLTAGQVRDQQAAVIAGIDAISSWLGSAVSVPQADPHLRAEPVFAGRGDVLKFVTLSNADAQAGGLVAVEISSAPQQGRSGRQLMFRSWVIGIGDPVRFSGTGARRELLLRNVSSIELSYYGAKGDRGIAGWHSDWLEPVPPKNVALRLGIRRTSRLVSLQYNFRVHSQ